MSNPYFLLFKTAQSEFRAWRNIEKKKQEKISVVVEITRGRRIRGRGVHPTGEDFSADELRSTPGVFGFSGNLKWLSENLQDHPGYILDLTREFSLECQEVLDLKFSGNGYENWVQFYSRLLNEGHKVYPVLQVSVQDTDTEASYVGNLAVQFQSLAKLANRIFYRAAVIEDSEFFLDIISLKEILNEFVDGGGSFFIILDHGFIRSGTASLHAVRTANYIANLRSIIPGVEFVIMGTSFPRDVEELGDPESGSFRTEESFLFEEVRRLTNEPEGIEYGDYGSINPERFDGITRGWRPRVDYPTNSRRIIYEREKRAGQGSAYSTHYASVARKIVAKREFIEDDLACWGRTMIFDAAKGTVPGSAPSFWTSVRMQIYVEQQIRRLGL